MTLRTLNYGNYGILLILGHAGCITSTVISFREALGCVEFMEVGSGISGCLGSLGFRV